MLKRILLSKNQGCNGLQLGMQTPIIASALNRSGNTLTILISLLQSLDDQTLSAASDILKEVFGFYLTLIGSSTDSLPGIDLPIFRNMLPAVC